MSFLGNLGNIAGDLENKATQGLKETQKKLAEEAAKAGNELMKKTINTSVDSLDVAINKLCEIPLED